MRTYFVVRDTFHPAEDIQRNWSAPVGGFSTELAGMEFGSKEEAENKEIEVFGAVEHEFRFHPAYDSFVEFHYEGLGAYCLEAENLEEAIEEASTFEEGLAVTMEAGDGHFYAKDVVSFHEVREGRFVFEIKY